MLVTMKRSSPFEIQPDLFPSDPLSDEMWDALEDIMLQIDNDDAFIAPKLEGYIAGVLCCPARLRPSEWFPPIWGSDQTAESLGEVRIELVVRLVMQHYNYVKSCLEDPEAQYDPRYQVDTDGSLLWEIWAEGFSDAIEVGHRGWNRFSKKAIHSEMASETVMTLMGILDLAEGGVLVPEEDREELLRMAPHLIPAVTKAMYELNTRGKTNVPGEFRDHAELAIPKVGRNDPCPCGSGQKYKKCHGA